MAARASLAILNLRRSSLEVGGKKMPGVDRGEGTERKKQTDRGKNNARQEKRRNST
jgi:hypothetical protein